MQSSIRRAIVSSLSFVFLFLLPSGCLKDFPTELPREYEWKPEFAFPIGELEFKLSDTLGFDPFLLEDTLGFPFWNYLESIPLSAEINFDFDQLIGESEYIELVIFRFNFYNGFPMDVNLQVYLENGSGERIDSLFSPNLVLQQGEADGAGKTESFGHTQADAEFISDRIQTLSNTKKIVISGELDGIDSFPAYSIKLQLGAIVGIKTDF